MDIGHSNLNYHCTAYFLFLVSKYNQDEIKLKTQKLFKLFPGLNKAHTYSMYSSTYCKNTSGSTPFLTIL